MEEISVKKLWALMVFAYTALIVCTFIKCDQIREVQAMRTMLVPVEVTDTQYYALQSMALFGEDVHATAHRIATTAITVAADREAKRVAEELERGQDDSADNASVPTDYAYDTPSDTTSVSTVIVPAEGKLTASKGVHHGPSGRETYYNLPMEGIVGIARSLGYTEEEYPYWIREDGAKMLGPYVICAANLQTRPRGTILDTSLGEAIVMDTGGFVAAHPDGVDLATNW